MLDVAGVAGRGWLEDQNLGFVVRGGAVLDPARHDDELTGAKLDRAIAELDAEATSNTEEQLVLAFVMVPYERPAELHQLHFLPTHSLSHAVGTQRDHSSCGSSNRPGARSEHDHSTGPSRESLFELPGQRRALISVERCNVGRGGACTSE